MKQLILPLIIFFLLSILVSAQTDKIIYKNIENQSYRTGSNQTDYMRKRCCLDLYYPVNKPGFATVVWFHGGGLTSGEKFIPGKLKNQGIAIAAVNYRLNPGVKCPEYIEDAAAAIAWVFRHISEYGGSTEKIVVSGHSAGGYLTMMTGLDKRWLAAYNIDANKIALLVPLSGHTITHMTVRQERGISDKQPVVDEFAPLWYVRQDAPPLFLVTGDRELEMLGRYEENAYLWRMMKISGHKDTHLYELDGFDHGGMADPGFDLLLKFIKERIK
jgi:acetyl esterase/lipase